MCNENSECFCISSSTVPTTPNSIDPVFLTQYILCWSQCCSKTCVEHPGLAVSLAWLTSPFGQHQHRNQGLWHIGHLICHEIVWDRPQAEGEMQMSRKTCKKPLRRNWHVRIPWGVAEVQVLLQVNYPRHSERQDFRVLVLEICCSWCWKAQPHLKIMCSPQKNRALKRIKAPNCLESSRNLGIELR